MHQTFSLRQTETAQSANVLSASHAERVAQLRASLLDAVEPSEKHARVPLGCDGADLALKGGLKKGALHEIFSVPGHETAATGFALAAALRISSGKPLLWIRQDFSALEQGELAATGLMELGCDPSRLLILRVTDAESAVRAAGDALVCTALGAILIEISGEAKILNLVTSRRLTLATAQHGVPAFLLRFWAQPDSSAAETRWLIGSAHSPTHDDNWGKPRFETDLVRNRHGNTGRWVMEWCCDDGIFREPAADCGAVAGAASDGPSAAAMESARSFRAA
jgi:protein ImuA